MTGPHHMPGTDPGPQPAVPDVEAIAKPWRDACEQAQDAYVLAMEDSDRAAESAHRGELRARLRYSRYAEVVNAIDQLLADEAAWVVLDAQRTARGVS